MIGLFGLWSGKEAMDGALQLWQMLVSTPHSLAHWEGRVL
jgi:hypothetical protein